MRSSSSGRLAHDSFPRRRHGRSTELTGALAVIFGVAVTATTPMASLQAQQIPLGLDRYLPVPDGEPLTAARIDLGRRLFFDPILSRDRSIACATCHIPGRAFTDGRPVSVGIDARAGTRNVPTLVNRAYGRSFFWDGRTTSLEVQVLRPIEDSLEMGLEIEAAIERLQADAAYVDTFGSTFGAPPSADRLATALAAYVRTILSGNSRFDRFEDGDAAALTTIERAGLRLFRGKAGCVRCHVGPNLTDEQFHNTGAAWRDAQFSDTGRYAVTAGDTDRGAFKTPTLRDVARTDPYMHDGSLATLEDVVEFYDRGGNANPFLDAAIHPLGLSRDERDALTAFLRTLSSESD